MVDELGPDVTGFAVGDDVLGFVDTRSSQAELVVVEAEHLVPRPPNVPWEVAGSLFVAGTTAYAAVRAVKLDRGDTVVVSGAAGGVGSVAVQLAVDAGATVIGLASEGHHRWLSDHGVIPVTYGDAVVERISKESNGHIDAVIDTFGGGYVEMAIGLGVAPDRIDTIIDFGAATAPDEDRRQRGGGRHPGPGRTDRTGGRRATPRSPSPKFFPLAQVRGLPGTRGAAHSGQDRLRRLTVGSENEGPPPGVSRPR